MTRPEFRGFINKMATYIELDHDYTLKEVVLHDDGSIEVEVRPDDNNPPDAAFRVVIEDAGTFDGHPMVALREEPKVIINAIPKMVVACILEL